MGFDSAFKGLLSVFKIIFCQDCAADISEGAVSNHSPVSVNSREETETSELLQLCDLGCSSSHVTGASDGSLTHRQLVATL